MAAGYLVIKVSSVVNLYPLKLACLSYAHIGIRTQNFRNALGVPKHA